MDWTDYKCEGQLSLNDLFTEKAPLLKIHKPIRLIELFGGIGAQALALERLGADFEHYRLVEFDKYPVASYNAIHKTNFEPLDITKINGSDLGIVEKDKYCYLMTYSFPCTDLSIAGKMEGMSKDSGTRSGLLWEVERLLNETEQLPDILVMENVTQVHGKKNINDFNLWIKFLESKGYTSTYFDMNSKDYGIPQNRNRTFMVSWLGYYRYEKPEPIELKHTMHDYLENDVEEKFYINSDRAKELVDKLVADGTLERTNERTNERTVDLSINEPRSIDVANTIRAKDRGVEAIRSSGNGVFVREDEPKEGGTCPI